MDKNRIFANILFVFGILFLIFTISLFAYQIPQTITYINEVWPTLNDRQKIDGRSYQILIYAAVAFKLILSSYGIYSRKHMDDAVNPLFTFTILFIIFVILETMSFVQTLTTGVLMLNPIEISTITVDLIVAVFYLVITLTLKIDDWREIE